MKKVLIVLIAVIGLASCSEQCQECYTWEAPSGAIYKECIDVDC